MKSIFHSKRFASTLIAASLALPALAAIGQEQAPAMPTAPTGAAAPAGAGGGRRGGGNKAPAKPWVPVYTADGQQDWQGFWRANPGGDTYDITGKKPRPDYNLQGDGTPKPGVDRVTGTVDGTIPYKPWAAAHYKEIAANTDDPVKPEYVDTQAHCLLEGPGRVFLHSGFEIVQTPGYITFLTEQNDEQVIVPVDGRPHVANDIKLWQGDRRGHWEGNTLVVDITNVKAKSRLDMSGDFYGQGTHFVERYTRVDDNTINYEATVTDPDVYTQPWTLNIRFQKSHGDDPHYELWEDACHEGERSADRLVIPPDVYKQNQAIAAKVTQSQK